MGQFLTKLDVEQVTDVGEQGRGSWSVTEPLVYLTDSGVKYTVPTGFVTDFASVPRLPIVFLFFGDRANESATLHDYLYTKPHDGLTRAQADSILKEASLSQGVSAWVAWALYLGVRVGGASHWS